MCPPYACPTLLCSTAWLAQLVEPAHEKLEVVGSSPTLGGNFSYCISQNENSRSSLASNPEPHSKSQYIFTIHTSLKLKRYLNALKLELIKLQTSGSQHFEAII